LETKLEVKINIIQDIVAEIIVKGDLTVFIQEFELLNKELLAYTKLGVYRFILNLNECNYIDSSGIGLIMRLAANASKQSSLICMICDRPPILKILAVSNIDKILHFVSDSAEGLKYYNIK